MPRQRMLTILGVLAMLGSLGVAPRVARAESLRTIGPTPPRLAFMDGAVSFWRPGAEDWSPARINTPLAAGDTLYAGDGANLEIAIGRRAFVRAGADTQLGIASLETGYVQLEVTAGHVALDLKRLPAGERVEVDTPHGAVTIDRVGYYRVDVDDTTAVTTRRGGPASVIPVGGAAPTDVAANEQVVLRGTEVASVSSHPAPNVDGWDRWNRNRTAQLAGTPRNGQYVSSNVAGVDDLDRAGAWHETPRYGPVWVPRDVPADWAPYSTGRWVWDPYYGWTWIDDAPWGWAPYHYGRWVWTDDAVWGWAPGPVVATAVYAPALVAFFGPVGVSVDIGIGFPFVSWVALGFGEPVFPWWGPIGFIGRPFWCGWGGPRIVNNIFINNRRIVNAQNINAFRNMTVRNAVMAVHRDQFGRGAVQPLHLTTAQAQRVQPVRGHLGVRPTAASLAPATGHALRPPDRIANRQVVATRPPQDPTRSLRTAGLAATGAARSAPRIVEATARSKGVQTAGRTRPPLPQTGHHPTGLPRQAPPRGVASRPSRTSTPPRGIASGPRRAPTPPRGVASGPSRASTPPRGFSSRSSSGSHPSFSSRPSVGRAPAFTHPSAPQASRAFQPRSSVGPRGSFGAPHAITSGRGGGPATRSRGLSPRG